MVAIEAIDFKNAKCQTVCIHTSNLKKCGIKFLHVTTLQVRDLSDKVFIQDVMFVQIILRWSYKA